MTSESRQRELARSRSIHPWLAGALAGVSCLIGWSLNARAHEGEESAKEPDPVSQISSAAEPTELDALLASAAERLQGGELQEAGRLLERLVAEVKDGARPALLLSARLLRARLLRAEGKGPQVLAELVAALPLADALAEDPERDSPGLAVLVRLELASALSEQNEPRDAAAFSSAALEKAVDATQLQLVPAPLRATLAALMDAGTSQAQFLAAVAKLDAALQRVDAYRLQPVEPPQGIGVLLEQLARQQAQDQEFELAAKTIELVLVLDLALAKGPDRARDERVSRNLAQVGWLRLQLRQLGAADEALHNAALLADSPTLASNRSSLAAVEGRYAEADQLAARGASLAQELGETWQQAALVAQRARLARVRGQAAETISFHEQAIALFARAGDGAQALRERVELGMALLRDEQVTKASELLEATDRQTRDEGAEVDGDVLLALRMALYRLDLAQGLFERGRETLTEAGALLFRLGRSADLAAMGSERAALELASGDLDRAREGYAAAQDLEADLGLGEDGWRALQGLGAVALSAGDLAEAADHWGAAMARLARTHYGVIGPTPRRVDRFGDRRAVAMGSMDRPLFSGDAETLSRNLVGLLLRLERPEQALDACERGQALGRLGRLEDAGARTPALDPGMDELLTLRIQLDDLRARLQRISLEASEELPAERRARLIDRMEPLLDRERALLTRLRSSQGVRALSWDAQAVRSVAELRQGLEPDQQVLRVCTAGERLVLFAIDRDGVTAHTLDGEAWELERRVQELRPLLQRTRLRGAAKRRLTRGGEQLRRWLLGPVRERLENAGELFWVPTGALWHVPPTFLFPGGRAPITLPSLAFLGRPSTGAAQGLGGPWGATQIADSGPLAGTLPSSSEDDWSWAVEAFSGQAGAWEQGQRLWEGRTAPRSHQTVADLYAGGQLVGQLKATGAGPAFTQPDEVANDRSWDAGWRSSTSSPLLWRPGTAMEDLISAALFSGRRQLAIRLWPGAEPSIYGAP